MEHLSDLKETARQAFYWNSFDPEKSGNRTLREHEEQLQSDLVDMPETEKERYIENYRKYFIKWLNAHSNCASSAVTGGSGFNVRRNEKANNREHAAYGEFIEWRERALKAIKRSIEASKSPELKQDEAWERLKRNILNSAKTIKDINDGVNKYSAKSLFVSSIYKTTETFANKGEVEIVNRAVDLIRELNKQSSIITERHKFFRLIDVAKKANKFKEELSNKENQEQPFNGGIVVFNYQENRLQLLFDEKPSFDIIQQLKKNGFRWSPRFSSWQRQLTNNAIYATKRLLRENNLICR